MNALAAPPHRNDTIRIDSGFLMRRLPALSEVKRKRVGWNELGAGITRTYQPRSPRSHRKDSPPADSGPPAADSWPRAKELLHNIMATDDPENARVRKRLGDFRSPSTAALFSTLSLYLAGKLGISLALTQPVLAVMLYAVHEASGDWDVLHH